MTEALAGTNRPEGEEAAVSLSTPMKHTDSPAGSVGILTFHFVPNYGAVWQTYALQEALRAIGHNVEVVDYRPRHVFGGGRLRLPVSRRAMRGNIISLYQLWTRFRARFGHRRELEESFEAFRERYLRRSARAFFHHPSLREGTRGLRCIVCGSDQIWNPSGQHGLDEAYFGAVAIAGCRRVAYAASFGRDDLHGRWLPVLEKLVNEMDAVSVREASGVEFLKRAGVRGFVEHTPDPTLLLDAVRFPVDPAPPGTPSAYLFSYVLRSEDGVTHLRKAIAEDLGVPVLTPLNPHGRGRTRVEGISVCLPSPTQWLGLIRGSAAVVTNSYHGTLFSILFQKPFLVVGIGSGKGALNERAKSLLERLGLMDRFLSTDATPEEAKERMRQPIDHEEVRRLILSWRKDALQFLDRAVTGRSATQSGSDA